MGRDSTDEDEERLVADALCMATIALKCLAYEATERATVQAVLPKLEGMLRGRVGTARFDPDTGDPAV
jgi:hypothetical protein